MAQFTHLSLYAKTFELTKLIYRTVKQFSKEFKFTLGEDIIRLIWRITDGIMRANSVSTAERLKNLEELSLDFDRFKIRLRLAYEIGLIRKEKYGRIQIEVAEIGKMIGGWQKWVKSKTSLS